MTILQIAESTGKRPEAIYMKLRRTFPGISFSKNSELDSAHLAALQTDKRGGANKPANAPVRAPKKIQVYADVLPKQPVSVPKKRTAILGLLLAAPTAASVTNIYTVALAITQEEGTAVLYTIVLACSALGFTVANFRSWLTFSLSALLIAFESFCNLSRLYHGLMGGVSGNPTRFLGTVTEIFNSGSHGTALIIAGFSALMLAAVQYAAIFELQKR